MAFGRVVVELRKLQEGGGHVLPLGSLLLESSRVTELLKCK